MRIDGSSARHHRADFSRFVLDIFTAPTCTGPPALCQTLRVRTAQTLPVRTAQTLPVRTAQTLPVRTAQTLPVRTAQTLRVDWGRKEIASGHQ
jgi:hypothetical protein